MEIEKNYSIDLNNLNDIIKQIQNLKPNNCFYRISFLNIRYFRLEIFVDKTRIYDKSFNKIEKIFVALLQYIGGINENS